MKKQISAFLLLSAIVFTSCQNFPTAKVQTTLEQDFSINRTGTTFNESTLIDATNDADFDKYKRKINSIDIDRVTYTITSFTGPSNQILQNGILSVADADGKNPINVATFTNLNLSNDLGQEKDLQTSSAGLARLQDLLRKDPYQAVISYSGNVNQGPVKMNISLKFYSKLTARIVGSN